MDWSQLAIAEITNAAREASEQIMLHYKKDCAVYKKADHSPVTDADFASHNILVDALPKIAAIPIISEESKQQPTEPLDRFWLIDPLDGTRGFINQTDDFAVNIAIVEDKYPVFGMIAIPISGDFFYAIKGEGAFMLKEGKWHKIRVSLDKHCTILGNMISKNEIMMDLMSHLDNHSFTKMGSAIKFTIIASGKATIYPRFSPTSWWDVAAGQCLVEEAGGKVVDGKLRRMRYDDPKNMLNSRFIAYAYDDPRWCDAWLGTNA